MDAKKAILKIGFPAILRVGFALGGLGSKVVRNKKEFKLAVVKALSVSPQVLIEEYLGGWKEIEYEVVRDSLDNCFINCNMENLDPVGLHTGESFVVSPSQTQKSFTESPHAAPLHNRCDNRVVYWNRQSDTPATAEQGRNHLPKGQRS